MGWTSDTLRKDITPTMNRSMIDTLRDLLVIALMPVILGQTLWAQDLPSTSSPDSASAKAPSASGSDWTGFYIGAHGGVLGGSSAWSATQPGAPTLWRPLNLFRAYDVFDGSGSQFGGLVAGYNYMPRSRIVIGFEADVSFAAEPATRAVLYNDTTELFGTARGRAGYKANRWLYYWTGGLAWTRDQFNRTDVIAGSAEAASANRIGWTMGAGIEASLARGWTAKAEYLYSQFGKSDVAFPLGAHLTSDLSMHQGRLGLNYRLGSEAKPEGGPLGIAPLDIDNWSVHGQTTYVSQYAPQFRAPYRGANSLASNAGRETWDATLYVGRRLWQGAELWINPEIDQGFGLSNTLGVAGFTSGEAYKVGFTHPYLRVPRALVRLTFDLGGATERVEAGLNQFADSQTANRLVLTVGRFSVSDLFDTITYAHDPRNDFMNWSLVDAGTWDYAADAWGFTYGAAVEWYEGNWTVRAGLFDLSIVPNSIELDHHFDQFQTNYELEHRHKLMGKPGKLGAVGFLSRGRMGRFDDALTLAQQTGGVPSTADVRRYASRPGVNVNAEQQIAPGVAIFGRVGWTDGNVEPYEFTDIDHTVSAGLSLAGKLWGRSGDTLGLATVVNGVSDVHTAYLNAGGLGILVGDGQLPHPGSETIVETYYRLPIRSWQVTVDYQFIANPAFNRDRGPVSVLSARLRSQF
jgi:high affinity Mn2+ porin